MISLLNLVDLMVQELVEKEFYLKLKLFRSKKNLNGFLNQNII